MNISHSFSFKCSKSVFYLHLFLLSQTCTHVQVPNVLSSLSCKSYYPETKCLSRFFLSLQPENSLPESCLYDLVAVVVHHGSG